MALIGLAPSDKVLTAWVALRYYLCILIEKKNIKFNVKKLCISIKKNIHEIYYILYGFSPSKVESGCLRFIPGSHSEQANIINKKK